MWKSTAFIIATGLIFIAVVVGLEGLFIWWNGTRGPEARRIAKRLRMMSDGGHTDDATVSLLKKRLLSNSPAIQQFLAEIPRIGHFDRFLSQTGTRQTVSSFVMLTTGAFCAGFAVSLAIGIDLVPAAISGAVAALLPLQLLLAARSKRTKRFEAMLPESLDLISRALRAGHSFASALQLAGTELPDPVGEEFRQTFDEINFGVNAHTALQSLASRVPSTDLGYFVIAVLIQRETGGNLTEVLDNIGSVIRERLKLFGKVKSLSAEGRISAVILAVLPFATAFVLYLLNPEFIKTLWTEPMGRKMLAVGGTMMALGILMMRSIVKIRV